MTPELNPIPNGDEPVATKSHKTKKRDKPTSEKQVAANRTNAQKSTGPKSPPGKAISRRNSLKHGHCALSVTVPGEDPTLFKRRFDAWKHDLNPHNDETGDYLVTLAVRRSLKLDRLHVVQESRAAELARSAVKVRATARAKAVEDSIRLLKADCDIAVRQLKSTSEGCDALIVEWTEMRGPLIEPATWDADDRKRCQRLLGNYTCFHDMGPNVLALPTAWIKDHREVKTKLDENLDPAAVPYVRQYHNKAMHQHDRDQIDHLTYKAHQGTLWITRVIDGAIEDLRAIRDLRRVEEAEELAEVSLRARVDTSDEGRLLERYAGESERALLKLIGVLRATKKEAAKTTQVDDTKAVTSSGPVEEPVVAATESSRNEPISGAATDQSRPMPPMSEGGPRAPKRSRDRRKRRSDRK